MGWMTGIQSLAGAVMEFFLFTTMSGLALGPTQQPLTQWVPVLGLLPQGYSGKGMKLTTHLHLEPRSRMC